MAALTVLAVALGVLLVLAGVVHQAPRLGKWIAGAYAILVIAVLAWSLLTGRFMAPAAHTDSAEEGCGYERVC